MNKDWRVKKSISDEFIKRNPGINQILLQVLYNRNIKDTDEIRNFLDGANNDLLNDPFLFNQMEDAVDLVVDKIVNKQKITIYGDYDADGVTASALLYQFLTLIKADVNVYIPDRVSEDYGVNLKAIKEIKKRGSSLIITVDTGIRSYEEIAEARELGIDVVLTDHHPSSANEDEIPKTIIIDPQIKEEKYPFKKLAGVGVAYKLAKAILVKSKLNAETKEKIERSLLDLVAIGSVADVVPLIGENRVLTKLGLEVLNITRRKGVNELIKIAGLNKGSIDSFNIGFQLGPRLNAAGRLDHANTAFQLLVTKDLDEARGLAEQLHKRNSERQLITEEIVEMVEEQINPDDKILIGICPPEIKAWNEGVVGLVAGRICEKYYRPTLVLTVTKEGYKGSGRSVDEFNLAAAVEKCSHTLTKYGGHPRACGLAFEENKKDEFVACIRKIAEEELAGKKLMPKIDIDAELDLSGVDDELLTELAKLEPHGEGNKKPVFVARRVQIKDIVTMGVEDQHIKFRFNGIWGLAFNKAQVWAEHKIGDHLDIVYYPEINYFNGTKEIQVKLVDIKST